MSKEDNRRIEDFSAFNFLIVEFRKESDRAAVILVASLIDEKLTALLKTRFIASPSANDDLFDGANGPLSTFSSKIDISFRIGLVSGRLCRDLHLIRRIRNDFAHNIYGCTFDNGSVKSRIHELYKSCALSPYYEHLLKEKNAKVDGGTRGAFLFLTSAIVFWLDKLIAKTGTIVPVDDVSTELPYADPTWLIEKRKESAKTESVT